MAAPLVAIGAAIKIIGATLAATSVASDVYHQLTDESKGQRSRRSPDRYQPTSFDYTLKGGLSPIDSVQRIGGIVNLGTLQKLNTVPKIKPFEVAGYTRQQRYIQQPKWNELTDPLNLNSFSDVLLNQEGKAQRMSDLGLTNTPLNLPGVRTIVLGVDMLKNQVLDPALKGEGGKLFMNLTNWLGEDMDTIEGANLVKGLILEKDKSKVFTRALGFGKEGRYTYDYSIYNPEMGFVESLGKEMVSSPSFWLTFGAKALLKAPLKMFEKTVTESIDDILKQTSKTLTNESKDTLVKDLRLLYKKTLYEDLDINKAISQLQLKYGAKQIDPVILHEAFTNFNKHALNNTASNISGFTKAVLKTDKVVDELSSIAFKSVGGLGWGLQFTGDAAKYLRNNTLHNLSKLTNKSFTNLNKVAEVTDIIKVKDLISISDNLGKLRIENYKKTYDQGIKGTDFYETLHKKIRWEEFASYLSGGIKQGYNLDDTKWINYVKDYLLSNGIDEITFQHLIDNTSFGKYIDSKEGYLTHAAQELHNIFREVDKANKSFLADLRREMNAGKTNFEKYNNLHNYFIKNDTDLISVYGALKKLAEEDEAYSLTLKEFEDFLIDSGFSKKEGRALVVDTDALEDSTKVVRSLNLEYQKSIEPTLKYNETAMLHNRKLEMAAKEANEELDKTLLLPYKEVLRLDNFLEIKNQELFEANLLNVTRDKEAGRLYRLYKAAEKNEVVKLNKLREDISTVRQKVPEFPKPNKKIEEIYNIDRFSKDWEQYRLTARKVVDKETGRLIVDTASAPKLEDYFISRRKLKQTEDSKEYLNRLQKYNDTVAALDNSLDEYTRYETIYGEEFMEALSNFLSKGTKLDSDIKRFVDKALAKDPSNKGLKNFNNVYFAKRNTLFKESESYNFANHFDIVYNNPKDLYRTVKRELTDEKKYIDSLNKYFINTGKFKPISNLDEAGHTKEVLAYNKRILNQMNEGDKKLDKLIKSGVLKELEPTIEDSFKAKDLVELDNIITDDIFKTIQDMEFEQEIYYEVFDRLLRFKGAMSRNLDNVTLIETLEDLQEAITRIPSSRFKDIKNPSLRNTGKYVNEEEVSMLFKLLDIKDKLDEVLIDINNMNINKYDWNDRIYKVKLSQIYTAALIREGFSSVVINDTTGETVLDLIRQIADGEKGVLPEFILGLANNQGHDFNQNIIGYSAKRIVDKAKGMRTTENLELALDKLKLGHSKNLDRAVKDTLLDLLETIGNLPATKVRDMLTENPDYIRSVLVDRNTMNKMTGVAKNENFYNAFVRTWAKNKGYETVTDFHDASADVVASRQTLEYFMGQNTKAALELKQKLEGRNLIVFDLETISADANYVRGRAESVLQIGAQSFKVVNGKLIPSSEMLDLVKNQDFDALPENLKRLWKDNETFKQKLGASTLESEEDLFDIFADFVSNIEKPIFVGQNIENFDLDIIKSKNPLLNEIAQESVDTLGYIRDVFKSSIEEVDETIMDEYVKKVTDLFNQAAQLQSTIGNNFITRPDALFQDNLISFAKDVSTLIKNTNRTGMDALTISTLEDTLLRLTGRNVTNMEATAKSAKKAFNEGLTVGTGIEENVVDATRDAFTKIKETNINLSKYVVDLDKLEKVYGTRNIFSVLNAGKRTKGGFNIAKYGVKKLYDPQHIPIIKADANLMDMAKRERMSRSLDRIYRDMFRKGDDGKVYSILDNKSINARDLKTVKALMVSDFEHTGYLKYVDLENMDAAETYTYYLYLSTVFGRTDNFNIVQTTFKDARLKQKLNILNDAEKAELSTALDMLKGDFTNVTQIYDAQKVVASYGSESDLLELMGQVQDEWASIFDNASLDIQRDAFGKLMEKEISGHGKFIEEMYNNVTDYRNLLMDEDVTVREYAKTIGEPLYKQIAFNQAASILTLTPEDFAKFMLHTKGYIIIPPTAMESLKYHIATFLNHQPMLEELGISVIRENDNLVVFIKPGFVNQLEKLAKEKPSINLRYTGGINVEDKVLLDAKRNFNRIKEAHGSVLPFDMYNDLGITGVDSDEAFKLLEGFDKAKELMLTAKERSHLAARNTRKFDYTILGDLDTIKRYNKYTPRTLFNAQQKAFIEIANSASSRSSYLAIMHSDAFQDSVSNIYKQSKPEDILSFFNKREDFTAIVYYQNNKGEVRVKQIRPRSLKDVEEMKRLNAVVVSKELANKIAGTVNEPLKRFRENHPYIALWREYVIGTYKNLFLTSVGFPIRNYIDTQFKNASVFQDGPGGILNSVRYTYEAHKTWQWYNDIMYQIMKGSTDDAPLRLTKYKIDAFFRKNPSIDRARFEMVHEYATSSISAGLSKSQADAVDSFVKLKHNTSSNLYKQYVFENALTKTLMNTNSNIEHMARLGLYMEAMARGDSKSQAAYKVLKAHFDYTNVSYFEIAAENIFPFITFPIRNIEFWGEYAVKNPWLIRFLSKASIEGTDLRDNTQFMLDNSRHLQNKLMSGNWVLDDNIFKINPSVFDAAKLIIAPGQEAESRLAPPFKVVYDGVKELATKDEPKVYSYKQEEEGIRKVANEWGFFSFTRAFDYVTNNFEQVKNGEWVPKDAAPPSLFGESYTNRFGSLANSASPTDIAFATLKNKVDAKKLLSNAKQGKAIPKVGPRAAYNSNRRASTKRYYTNSFNFYNRWKAQSAQRRHNMRNVPPTPESVARSIKGVFYNNGLKPPGYSKYRT